MYLDRVGRHVAHEVRAVGVIQHGHQSEGVPQQTIQLVDVLSRWWRLTQEELWLDAYIIWRQHQSYYISMTMFPFQTREQCLRGQENFLTNNQVDLRQIQVPSLPKQHNVVRHFLSLSQIYLGAQLTLSADEKLLSQHLCIQGLHSQNPNDEEEQRSLSNLHMFEWTN